MSARRSVTSLSHSSTISGRFLRSGRTATLYGARSVWKASTIRFDEEGEGGAVGARGGLNYPRRKGLFGRRVEICQVLARRGGVPRQVPVTTIVDAFEFLPAEREAVLDIDCLLGVVGHLVRCVLPSAQPGLRYSIAQVPRPAAWQPLLEDVGRRVRPHEVLH